MTGARGRSPRQGLFLAVGAAALIAGALIAFYRLRAPEFRLTARPPGPAMSDFTLIDYDGRPRSLADYRNHVVVIYFGYVHCPDACPAELFKLDQVMKLLGPASRQVQVLFITLDPERDTPQVLKDYVTAFNPAFVGLTGTAAQIDRAAAAFNVEHAKVPSGEDYAIDHSSETYVVDAGGHLLLRGSAFTRTEDFVHDLKLLVQ
jgi:protein SCO1/2